MTQKSYAVGMRNAILRNYLKKVEDANFSDFKRLVVTLKINPQKYNWPQKTCKPLKNAFPGSNWSVIVMRIEQSKVYAKAFVT